MVTKIVDWNGNAITVGAIVIFGAPEGDEEIERQTGKVIEITDPDVDYDDESGRAMESCPRVTIQFADGETEAASTYNSTPVSWADYPDGPEEYTYTADDLAVRNPVETHD